MRVELSSFVGRSLANIRKYYASIPTTEHELELNDDFIGEITFLKSPHPDAAIALSYLPKHITSIKFSGSYGIKEDVTHERIGYDTYLDYTYDDIHIGLNLPSYTTCLPLSVTSVSFAFLSTHIPRGRYNYSNTALIDAISSLGSQISHVDLSSMEFRGHLADIQRLCSLIPPSVTSLKARSNSAVLPVYLSWLPRTITHLNLSGSPLLQLHDVNLLRSLTNRHPQLASLSLGETNLGQRNHTDLGVLLSGLSTGLVTLKLNGNNLSRLSGEEIADVLSGLPETIEELDLGENGLLLMAVDELTLALTGLQPQVIRLRLGENNVTTLQVDQLIRRLRVIPAQIDTLDFSDCNLFGLSVDDFCALLRALPQTVTTLTLSNNVLTIRYFDEWAQILASVPTHITTVLLEKNKLGCLEADALVEIFASCPPHIKRLGLSHNGFSNLLASQLERRLRSLPDVILDFSNDNSRREEGSLGLASLITRPYYGLFKTHFVVKKQQQFAELLPGVMQLMASQKGLNPNIMGFILSFLVNDLSKAMQQCLETRIIAQTRPEVVSPEMLRLTINTVDNRLYNASTTQATRVDLSRCGLNRIERINLFRQLFDAIPEEARAVNLTGNGFCQNNNTLAGFIKALKYIPGHITHLDLSHNGFELFNDEQLEALFVQLPPTVLHVKIGDGKPLSPAIHIGVRRWPHSYESLIKPCVDLLLQARALLDDYTKGDSWYWRVFFLHWARHHTDEVARLVMRIDNGLINNTQDLLGELALIEPRNEVRSLGRRISFLTSKSLQATVGNRPRLALDAVDEVEMITMSHPC